MSRTARSVADRLVTAEKQLLDVAEDVELLRLHLVLEGVDDVPGKAEAGPELDEDFPDNKGKNPAAKEGIIAFQAHAGYAKMRVEFKDIKFTDLSKK